MGTVTYSLTEDYESSYQASWVFSFTGTNVTATGSTVSVAIPTATAKMTGSGKATGRAQVDSVTLKAGTVNGNKNYKWYLESSWASGATKTLPIDSDGDTTPTVFNTSDIFTSANSTSRTVNVALAPYSSSMYFQGSSWNGNKNWNLGERNVSSSLGTIATITLNAPPILSNATASSTSKNGIYWTEDSLGLANSQVKVTGYSVQYGADANVTLTVGEKTVTSTSTAGIYLPIVGIEAGTYSPVLTVTDSRGQSSTRTLGPIVIQQYERATYDISQVTSDINGFWVNKSNATVTVSNIVTDYPLEYLEFRLNGKKITKTLDGTETVITINIPNTFFDTPGTFTPEVYIRDNRRLGEHNYLNDITVRTYTEPIIGYTSLKRVNQNGIEEDEGTYALLAMTVNYCDALGGLLVPTTKVIINGVEEDATAVWYTNWSGSTGIDFTSTIDWTNYNPTSPVTIYALISGYGSVSGFNILRAYQISVIARDTQTNSLPIIQTLESAFYTIDFLAGGHGVAFGSPIDESELFSSIEGASAPTFRSNFYYERVTIDGKVSYESLSSEPSDWSTNWMDYYIKAHDSLFKCNMDMYLKDIRVPNIFISTSDPTSLSGEDGDIWIKYTPTV